MKIIDGKNAVLGRLASYVAKESLKGEEIVVLNCDSVIVTGRRKDIEDKWCKRRQRVGSGQKGPKHSRLSHLIVKRAIRGMLPDHRSGRGKIAFKKIKCYSGIPKEFEDKKKIVAGKGVKSRFVQVKEISGKLRN
ncbi:MAG: 50S ribosomal protein L13 [Candidatus Pacearchaeota archaeon]